MLFSNQEKFQSEQGLAKFLISESSFLDDPSISETTEAIIQFCRKNLNKRTKLDAFMEEYGLSNFEGIALMCLAESLMRIPDDRTRDSLIKEKLTSAKWSEHLGKAESFLVNSATWGLAFSKEFLQASNHSTNNWLISLGKKIGETSIREAVRIAMQVLSKEFVCAERVDELKDSSWLTLNRCSFDMLGEASRNRAQEKMYFESYLESINLISEINQAKNLTNGISIKLSALYSKYDSLHTREVKQFLLPRIRDLLKEAAQHDVAVTIDAEEQDRLSLSLELLKEVAMDPSLKSWPKLGLAVQAYGKRSLQTIAYLDGLSKKREKMHVRLVKGAYWDHEIKNAQVRGLEGYTVYTNKHLTDLSYLVTAKKLLDCSKLEACFATHNAHSIAAIMNMVNQDKQEIEFQRLYGMGELLYSGCQEIFNNFPNTSIYCPVGEHKELLPYLVRRLLENGANSSFINKYLNPSIPLSNLSANPAELIKDKVDDVNLSNLDLPSDLYLPRINSKGLDLSEEDVITDQLNNISNFTNQFFHASPISNLQLPQDEAIEIYSKCTNKNIGKVSFANTDAISQFNFQTSSQWADATLETRSTLLNKVADSIEERRSEFLYLLAHEAGKTLADSSDEVREAVDFLRYYAEQVLSMQPLAQRGPTGEDNVMEYSPKGVVLCISPWNFPLAITLGQIAAALVTGNTVIAKPSEFTSLIAHQALNLFFQHGLPEDALHLVVGDGDVGEKIVECHALDLVVFTGSLKVAKNIQKNLSLKPGKIIPLVAETGGLNSMIVDSSALLERACDDIIRSAFNSAGQRCSALRILLVHEKIYSELISMVKGVMDDLIIGTPLNPSVDIGPIINLKASNRLQKYLSVQDESRDSTYQIELPEGCDENWFAPTLIEMSSIEHINEEQFGPILHAISFSEETLNNLLDQIDKKGFGLTFGIHTRIDSRALNAAKLMSGGNIYVNRDIVGAVVESQPFGGKNLSGTGFKAGGPNYLIQFIDENVISVNTVAIGGNAELINEANQELNTKL
jgi:RHH-type transcriptional regulator, proline utilization regulon repressor / proline dehydrogenase / delta 1-pyrroline-5-carboxylate dehydrogenase